VRDPMLALTILQPWAWAILRGGKRIENRRWRPPPSLLGKRFALHAGKSTVELVSHDVRTFITKRTDGMTWEPDGLYLGAMVGTAKLIGVVQESRDPWFAGPYGWVLDEVRELEAPIPCRGFQMLWKPTPGVEAQILEQEARLVR
jgi:hypothetical protein